MLKEIVNFSKELEGYKSKEFEAGTAEKTMEKIIKIMLMNPGITIKELAEDIGISKKGVEWQINKLKQEGKIKRTGPAKGGYWEVIKDEKS